MPSVVSTGYAAAVTFRHPRLLAVMVAAAVAVVGLSAWLVERGGGSSAVHHSGNSRANTPAMTVGSAFPTSYTVVYRVVRNGVHQWEVLSVQRPFQASDLVYTTAAAPGSGDRPVSGVISSMTMLYTLDAQTVHAVTSRQPGPPSGDEFLGGEVAQLRARGLANVLGTSRIVAGRTCENYRFSGPPAGPIAAVGSGTGDHDDLCLDDAGLVLAETWTYRGQQVLTRTAVSVASAATGLVNDTAPAAPSTEGALAPGPLAATVIPDAYPRSVIATPPTPTGFEPAGPALDFQLPDRNQPSQSAARSVVWAFVDGAHLITVEAGRQSSVSLPWMEGDTPTTAVMLHGLGAASTAVRSDGFEVRINLGNGDWVRVRGTVPLDQLVGFAHLLTRA